MFPHRKCIIDFGKSIGVKKGETIVDEMADQIKDGLDERVNYTEVMDRDIKAVILKNIYRSTTRTAIKSRPARQYTKYP